MPFSLIYGPTDGLTVVYTEFGFAESTTSSLSFIPILLGLLINILPRLHGQRLFTRDRKDNISVCPETKVGTLVTVCPALTVGLWLFAWTIPSRVPHVHWIVSTVGLVLVGYATNDLSYILFGYLTDSCGPYAASACSALSLSRTLTAAIFHSSRTPCTPHWAATLQRASLRPLRRYFALLLFCSSDIEGS